ncbi:hypothetical protein Tco_0364726 [Tanacetum coccineum]
MASFAQYVVLERTEAHEYYTSSDDGQEARLSREAWRADRGCGVIIPAERVMSLCYYRTSRAVIQTGMADEAYTWEYGCRKTGSWLVTATLFQELALLCVGLFHEEFDKIDRLETYLLRVRSSRILQEGMSKAKEHKNYGNQVGNDRAPTKVYAVGHAGTNQDSNVVTELGSFDAIIGMDWLAKYQAIIVCAEKIVQHPSETKVLHNEDGNPARANIKQALGSYERPHKGVKASANSDIMYFFTSAQDGDPLQDDVRLCLGDDLKKAQDHNQRQVKDESKDHYPKCTRYQMSTS